MEMNWWHVGSKEAIAARTATVFPAPTSPVSSPRADSATQTLMRAMASWCERRLNRSTRRSPCRTACGKARSGRPRVRCSSGLLVGRAEQARLGELDLLAGAGGLLVRGLDEAEVVDPRRRGCRPLRLGTARWVWRR